MKKKIQKQLALIKKVLKKYLPKQLRTKKAAGTAMTVAAVLAVITVLCLCGVFRQKDGGTPRSEAVETAQENAGEEGQETDPEESGQKTPSKSGTQPEESSEEQSGEDSAAGTKQHADAQEETAQQKVQRKLSSREQLLLRLLNEMPEKAAQYVLTEDESGKENDSDLLEQGIVLSFFTAPYPSNEGSEKNAKKAADYLNGAVVPPGEEFSYNRRIGERTKERGFVEAPVIYGSKMVPGLGGGICEISSMLYNLCLQSGLSVLERSPHSLLVPYVPGGLDAAVSWGSIDFRFENSYEVPVVLLAGYDDTEQIFLVAAVARGGKDLLGGTRYVPVSTQTGDLTYETGVEIWHGTTKTGIQKLGTSHYAGIDDAE